MKVDEPPTRPRQTLGLTLFKATALAAALALFTILGVRLAVASNSAATLAPPRWR